MALNLQANGIDLHTGQRMPGITEVGELARCARGAAIGGRLASQRMGLPAGADPGDMGQMGWAVVWSARLPEAHRKALTPLLELRRSQVGPLYKELIWPEGKTARQFLKANHATSSVDPRFLPYYLLLVGPPSEISFEAQCELDLDYGVGRLDLDDAASYLRYAEGVVAAEQGSPARRREVGFWAPRHDDSTRMSHDEVVVRLADGEAGATADWQRAPAAVHGFSTLRELADQATRPNLINLLRDGPGLLVVASHGIGVAKTDPSHLTHQGGLLGQGWDGFGPPSPELVLTAGVLDETVHVGGSVGLLLSCFGGGTPAVDDFPWPIARPSLVDGFFSGTPFVAALPKRLLSHPNGPALALLAHADRAWEYSFGSGAGQGRIGPFRNFVDGVMRGSAVGHATSELNSRYASMGATLAGLINPPADAPPVSDDDLAEAWIEFRDLRNYILLGDPAVRLRVPARI